jgi:hypothetical protein
LRELDETGSMKTSTTGVPGERQRACELLLCNPARIPARRIQSELLAARWEQAELLAARWEQAELLAARWEQAELIAAPALTPTGGLAGGTLDSLPSLVAGCTSALSQRGPFACGQPESTEASHG